MSTESIAIERKITVGTILQIITIIVSISLAWGSFNSRVSVVELGLNQQQQRAEEIKQQTNRIEKYLQSNDHRYWQKVKTVD